MEYLEKLKVYGDQVKNVVVKSMVDTACGGQKMLKTFFFNMKNGKNL